MQSIFTSQTNKVITFIIEKNLVATNHVATNHVALIIEQVINHLMIILINVNKLIYIIFDKT